ncbi:MAG TPA: CpsD/CapB family tyrosine-protein kinase [Candidatus Cybelea sp.]|nr:CpsD/CapB family tyrosine-protein kinase [Candidatus Cybelea sp.]
MSKKFELLGMLKRVGIGSAPEGAFRTAAARMASAAHAVLDRGVEVRDLPTKAVAAAEEKAKAKTTAESTALVDPAAREESLKLVQRLFLTPAQAPSKAVMFAPIDAGSACSRLCADTAELLAETASCSVCLVEGNFRRSSLPEVLGEENHYGLADSLRQEGSIRRFAKQVRKGLWLLSSGSQSNESLNLLNCDRMKERIAELRKEFDYVLVEVAPLNVYADAMVLGRLLDGVVLVLEANTTRREAALRVAESLRATAIPVLGAVLNNRTFPIPRALYKRL